MFHSYQQMLSQLYANGAPRCPRDLVKNWQLAPNSDSIVSIDEFLSNNHYSNHVIEQEQHLLNTPYRMIATSLTHKKLINAILGHWTAAALFNQPYIDKTALLGVQLQSPYYLSISSTVLHPSNYPAFINKVADLFVQHFHTYHRLSPNISWGNSALAIARPWLALQSLARGGHVIKTNALSFFAPLKAELRNAIDWQIVSDNHTHSVCIIQRRSCCLKYRLPNKNNCTTCERIRSNIHSEMN